MSKMQMLLFAMGIALVALLLLDFVSRIGLNESAKSLVLTNATVIDSQLSNDLLCSNSKEVKIPESLRYGFDQKQFFYDLDFSTQPVGTGENAQNLLIMSVSEHKKDAAKKSIIAAKSVSSNAEFILISPDFLKETSGLGASYGLAAMTMYPRAAQLNSTVTATSSPNAFIVLKEVLLGKKRLYIIPCSTYKEPNNCFRNILRVGCYQLKESPVSPQDSTLVPSCFNITVQVAEDKTRNFTWADCKLYFPEITNNA